MAARTRRTHSRRAGFTLVELAIVVSLIAVGAALGVPMLSQFFTDMRLKAAARDAADALRVARSEAIRSGVQHMVLLSAGLPGAPGMDPAGAPLPTDPTTGGPVPILIVQDDDEDCRVDAGEPHSPTTAPARASARRRARPPPGSRSGPTAFPPVSTAAPATSAASARAAARST
jgi:prepilin-type N-terminal cleavage/methylation domain-containing protein